MKNINENINDNKNINENTGKHINKYILVFLIILVVLSFLGSYVWQKQQQGKKPTAIIYSGDRVYRTVDLSTAANEEIKVIGNSGHYNIVEVKDGQICIKEADCPNKLCVKAGWLSKPGQIAVCVPNDVRLVIEGEQVEVDAGTF